MLIISKSTQENYHIAWVSQKKSKKPIILGMQDGVYNKLSIWLGCLDALNFQFRQASLWCQNPLSEPHQQQGS